MLDPRSSIPRDFSRFDKLSIEELREIIRQDSMLTEDEESDTDAILYIMEVLANREKSENDITDVKAAWQSFKEHYYPYQSDAEPLYHFEGSAPKELPATEGKNRHIVRPFFKAASIAAVIAAVLLAGTATVYALGYDLFGAFATWTHETFGFQIGAKNSNVKPFSNLSTALDAYGVKEPLVPQWLPKGYEEDIVQIMESPTGMTFVSTCEGTNWELIIRIVLYGSDNNRPNTYEANGEDVRVYVSSGTTHYLMKNKDQYRISWIVNNAECSIVCNLQEKDIYRMIDSIYER